MPGIVAGCIVVFMLTAGSYLTPILLGGKNSSWFTEQIYDQFITRYNWESGAAFGFLLLAFTSLVVWGGLKLRARHSTHGGAKLMACSKQPRLSRSYRLYVWPFFHFPGSSAGCRGRFCLQ
jgi:ABC-type Fe3+ transport system permease subunit